MKHYYLKCEVVSDLPIDEVHKRAGAALQKEFFDGSKVTSSTFVAQTGPWRRWHKFNYFTILLEVSQQRGCRLVQGCG